jgi:hypothetical protein
MVASAFLNPILTSPVKCYCVSCCPGQRNRLEESLAAQRQVTRRQRDRLVRTLHIAWTEEGVHGWQCIGLNHDRGVGEETALCPLRIQSMGRKKGSGGTTG